MTTRELNELASDAQMLIEKIDGSGQIYNSNDNFLTNYNILKSLDENKINILSILYNIANLRNVSVSNLL